MSTAAPRILVCNDDGIASPGLALLATAAQGLSDDVWVVAPSRKWTAASHQLTYDRDIVLVEDGPRRYVCDGAPADCVVAAMTLLVEGAPFGLALAGINDTHNVGEDSAYSGTMSIAREATFWGVPAIAVSRSARWTDTAPEIAALRRLLSAAWATRTEWAADGHWLGVNLPPRLPAALRGARLARDKIASAVDVVEHTPGRWVYRVRRGRPGTVTAGDENDVLRVGHVAVVRHGARHAGALDEDWLARMATALADDEPVG